jgi:hypothetical protein
MSIRKDENYNNRNKYSLQDVVEMKKAQAEQDSAADDYLAVSKAKNEERKGIVIRGLVSKYGFSQEGAEQTFTLIAKGENDYTGERAINNAKFASNEMKQAALRAYDFYWK